MENRILYIRLECTLENWRMLEQKIRQNCHFGCHSWVVNRNGLHTRLKKNLVKSMNFLTFLALHHIPSVVGHTIRKVKFLSKNSILTSFSPKFFWQFFSWNQSCQQLKCPKPQHFHEFFTPKNRQFSRGIEVEFLDKKWRFRTVWSSYIIFWWILLTKDSQFLLHSRYTLD